MKNVVARATFWVMCLFAYLFLSITFYQNAMAEECQPDRVCFMQKLLYSSDKNHQNIVRFSVVESIKGYEAGLLDVAASVAVVVDGANGDSWFKHLSNLQEVYEECGIFSMSNNDVVAQWMSFNATRPNMTVQSATILFMNAACDEQLKFIIDWAAVRKVPKPSTGT